MTLNTLQVWRFLAPGGLILMYGILLVYVVFGVSLDTPDLSKAPYLLLVLIPACLYYVTPLRRLVNKNSHERISENLRAGMVRISGYPDDTTKYTWPRLRPLFFKLVDDDRSLSVKAQRAYFNGLIWTALADSAVISCGYAIVSAVLVYFNVPRAYISIVVFLIISVFSLFANRVSTDIQINIGNEQLEHIQFEHKAAIERRLNQLD